MPTVYPTLIIARTNTSADGQSHPVESSRAVANSFKGMKNELMMCLFFVTRCWTPYALSVSTDKNLKDWRRASFCCTSTHTFSRKFVYMNFFPCFGMGTRAWNLCKYFRFTLYNSHWTCVSAIYNALGLRATKLSVDKTPSDKFHCEAIKR
jgi:hypothetical protein